MLIERKEIIKEIEKHQKKSDEAYANYQDTGYKRYETAHQKHENWADTLSAYLDAENAIRLNRFLTTKIRSWVAEIRNIEWREDNKKQEAINRLFDEIKATEQSIKM